MDCINYVGCCLNRTPVRYYQTSFGANRAAIALINAPLVTACALNPGSTSPITSLVMTPLFKVSRQTLSSAAPARL